jgi:PAS domain S-box-containing protein
MDFTRGYTREELSSLPFVKFIHPDDRELVMSRHLSRLQDPDKVMPVYSFRALDKNGQITWVEINTVRVAWENEPAVLFFLTDITQRLQAEQSLRESEARFRTLFENSPDAIVLIDPHDPKVDWPIIDCNNVFCRMNGYTQQELLGQSFSVVNNIEVKHDERENYLNTIRQAQTVKLETMHRNKDGSVFPVQTSSTLINLADREIILGIDRDISAQKALEEQLHQAKFNLEKKVQTRTAAVAAVNTKLKASLTEKEVLLKEIHHRVKNNMQVISSLLSLQSRYITDPQALEVFRDSQSRVRSMALIHEKLYKSENLARIDFTDYINDLTRVLFQSYQAHQQKVIFRLQSEKLFLELDQAIPCGLIINELISNTLKHAFPHGQGGTLTINLVSDEIERITLTVTDNGVGFPPDLDFQETETLGLQLVNSLVGQLDGTISQTHNGGTEYKIRFPGAK